MKKAAETKRNVEGEVIKLKTKAYNLLMELEWDSEMIGKKRKLLLELKTKIQELERANVGK